MGEAHGLGACAFCSKKELALHHSTTGQVCNMKHCLDGNWKAQYRDPTFGGGTTVCTRDKY